MAMTALTITLEPWINLTDEQFYQLYRNNPDVKFERNAKGDLVIMPPTVGSTGQRNSSVIIQLGIWNQRSQLGVVFDSSTGFKL